MRDTGSSRLEERSGLTDAVEVGGHDADKPTYHILAQLDLEFE